VSKNFLKRSLIFVKDLLSNLELFLYKMRFDNA
jgi:hypothetical protein